MEEEGPRGDMTIQSGLSNSTESIDSMKALTAAIEAANAQVNAFFIPFFNCEVYCQWTDQHLLCATQKYFYLYEYVLLFF